MRKIILRNSFMKVLFDLATLQAQCVFRTKQFDESEKIKTSHELTTRLIKKMLKEKVLCNKLFPHLSNHFSRLFHVDGFTKDSISVVFIA